MIIYENEDLKTLIRDDHVEFFAKTVGFADSLYDKTGCFFLDGYFINKGKLIGDNEFVMKTQDGILRTNCVDCLDRTNLYQSIIADRILERQLTEV